MEMLPLRDYIMDLSEEEWNSFADAMSNPRSKSGNCAGEQSTNLDLDLNPTSSAHGDTAVQCGGCFPCVKTASSTSDNRATTSESSMKKPRKGVFSRMISLISKKSSKICPEALG
ncbi:uncharacterized protein LOC134064045 isoform X2 [Sardina pilchardus]|uniref:uncharacterized protein LOC134064045 isoform X2 n=1 Tax=Sardina pilchardus TaxID=27697 RepID=UPI002E14121E